MKDCLLINEFDSETGARSHRSLPPVATREVNDGSLTSRPSSTPASSSSSQVIATGTTDGTPPPTPQHINHQMVGGKEVIMM
jgi:hypothetical protein